jgi:hypothetical protein
LKRQNGGFRAGHVNVLRYKFQFVAPVPVVNSELWVPVLFDFDAIEAELK